MTAPTAGGGARNLRLGIVVSSAVVLVSFALHAVRTAAAGHEALLATDAAMAKGDWLEAVARARAAAEAYVPGVPWAELGLRRLGTIGREAEMRGDSVTALMAYGAMRTAVLETRVIGSKGEPWHSVADQGLARLAASPADSVAARTPVGVAVGALHMDEPPSPGHTTAVAAGVLVLFAIAARGRP